MVPLGFRVILADPSGFDSRFSSLGMVPMLEVLDTGLLDPELPGILSE
jgi:hypothetical protein